MQQPYLVASCRYLSVEPQRCSATTSVLILLQIGTRGIAQGIRPRACLWIRLFGYPVLLGSQLGLGVPHSSGP